jgi:hypothetical protein
MKSARDAGLKASTTKNRPSTTLARSSGPSIEFDVTAIWLAHAHKTREHASQDAQSGWKAAAGVRTEPKPLARCVTGALKALPELEKDLEL